MLLEDNPERQNFIQETFQGLYFSDENNLFLDNTVANIQRLPSPFKGSLAISALNRACIKRRPRGVFTYVGHRYDDGRRDLRLSLQQQFLEAITLLNAAVFDNGQRLSTKRDGGLSLFRPPITHRFPITIISAAIISWRV